MDKKKFVATVNDIRAVVKKLDAIDAILGTEWTETAIVELFDIIDDLLIPGANDHIYEDYGNILWGKTIPDLDIEDFYDEYKESLK